MTNNDIEQQNSNGSPNLGAGSPNRGAGSQDGGAGSGIRRDPAEFNPWLRVINPLKVSPSEFGYQARFSTSMLDGASARGVPPKGPRPLP